MSRAVAPGSWGGRADKAVHLHMVQKEIRHFSAELKSIRSRRHAQSIDSVSNYHDVEGVLMMHINEKEESMIANAIDQWERKMCREEGMLLKTIRSAKPQ